jgi:hypothetical protein
VRRARSAELPGTRLYNRNHRYGCGPRRRRVYSTWGCRGTACQIDQPFGVVGQLAPVDTRSTPVPASQLADIRQLDEIRPADVFHGEQDQLARLLAPRPKATLGHHALAQPYQILDAGARTRDCRLDRRMQPVVGDRQCGPRLLSGVRSQRILART